MKQRRKIVTTGAITSRKLAGVSDAGERLYWRLYMASDNYGTMSGDPWDVFGTAMPNVKGWDDGKVSIALDELVEAGLLQRWVTEDVRAEWVHVLGHDRHQSADFLRKRGQRRTPEPPSQVCPKGSEGQTPSADAVPCPSGPLSVSVSTKETTPSAAGTASTAPASAPAQGNANAPQQHAEPTVELMIDAAAQVFCGLPGEAGVDHSQQFLYLQHMANGFSAAEILDAVNEMASQAAEGHEIRKPRIVFPKVVRRLRENRVGFGSQPVAGAAAAARRSAEQDALEKYGAWSPDPETMAEIVAEYEAKTA